MNDMTFDIIIPLYRAGEKFSRLLSMLEKQTAKPGKVIVMETLSEGEEVTEYPGCEVYPVKKQDFDHAGTRREGLAHSQADAVLFMTCDAVPADEFLCERLLSGLQSEGKGTKKENAMCYARQLPEESCREAEKYTRQFNYPEESFTKDLGDLPALGIKTYFASNVCCMYLRAAYEEAGGFPEDAIFNEDMICASRVLKAGYSIRYEAGAAVIHSHNYSAKEQFHRNFDLGMSQAMHPEVFSGIRSEGEGVKLVLSTAKHLFRKGQPFAVFGLGIHSAAKYLGYRRGKNYQQYSYEKLRRLSMNPSYIDRHFRTEK